MRINLRDDWELLSRRAKIFYIVFSALNLWLFFVLLFSARAGFFPSLIYFVFWQAAIWIYYMFRYKKRRVVRFGEWIDAGMFAVIAATIIRTLFIEAYQIPTPSMERSLLVGDFLFVSKTNYGARVPMTPISFPFVHHTIPVLNTKAYSEALELPYYRLPGFQKIKRNDVVVFNYPAENENRPVDKKENYIKRCLAIPGDSFAMRNGVPYVNGKETENPDKSMRSYTILSTKSLAESQFKSINVEHYGGNVQEGRYIAQLTQAQFEEISKWSNVKSVEPIISHHESQADIFPYLPRLYWNKDQYGPVFVPKAGSEIKLDSNTFMLYERIIREYENNPDLVVRSGKYFIGGNEVSTYTFKMNYYFMIGDNRHMSADSRYWGFVPEDHIVGKALFIWMSMGQEGNFFQRVRWNRIFNGIH